MGSRRFIPEPPTVLDTFLQSKSFSSFLPLPPAQSYPVKRDVHLSITTQPPSATIPTACSLPPSLPPSVRHIRPSDTRRAMAQKRAHRRRRGWA